MADVIGATLDELGSVKLELANRDDAARVRR
jgi:hypothetical protein